MAFTAKVGTALSSPGNIVLGKAPPSTTVQTFSGTLDFAGSIAYQLATSQALTAGLSFSGSLAVALRGEPAIHTLELEEVVIHTITLEAG